MGTSREELQLASTHSRARRNSRQPRIDRLAGAEGFEPSNTGSKVPRLTAWPRPNAHATCRRRRGATGPWRRHHSCRTRLARTQPVAIRGKLTSRSGPAEPVQTGSLTDANRPRQAPHPPRCRTLQIVATTDGARDDSASSVRCESARIADAAAVLGSGTARRRTTRCRDMAASVAPCGMELVPHLDNLGMARRDRRLQEIISTSDTTSQAKSGLRPRLADHRRARGPSPSAGLQVEPAIRVERRDTGNHGTSSTTQVGCHVRQRVGTSPRPRPSAAPPRIQEEGHVHPRAGTPSPRAPRSADNARHASASTRRAAAASLLPPPSPAPMGMRFSSAILTPLRSPPRPSPRQSVGRRASHQVRVVCRQLRRRTAERELALPQSHDQRIVEMA